MPAPASEQHRQMQQAWHRRASAEGRGSNALAAFVSRALGSMRAFDISHWRYMHAGTTLAASTPQRARQRPFFGIT